MASPATKIIDLYCRISEDYDGDGGFRSVDEQEEDGREDIAEHAHEGWRVGEVFKDAALSAWNPKVERPDWNRLMKRLESGQSHGVWVYDLSRFTRKPREGERLIDLAERGIIVISTDSEYDLTTADGKKQFRDHMNAAAHESDKTSQRSTRGKRKKARRGESNASRRGFGMRGYLPKPPGRRKKGEPRVPPVLAPDAPEIAAERAVVRELARRLLEGGPGNALDALTRDLNAREIRTVTGKVWTSQAVRQMLKRPSLAGLVDYKGEIIPNKTLPGEPVLDLETWNAIQALFASRRRGSTPAVYVLSGRMRCGLCGAVMYGRPRINCAPYEDGEVKREYWCQRRPQGVGCGRLTIDQRLADDAVERAVIKRLGDPRHAAQVARVAARVKAKHDKLVKEIMEAEEVGRALADRLGRGEMTLARYDAAATPLEERLTRLRAEVDSLERDSAADHSGSLDVAAEWEQSELAGRRSMVARAFPRLTLLPAMSRGTGTRTENRFDWDGNSLDELVPQDRSA